MPAEKICVTISLKSLALLPGRKAYQRTKIPLCYQVSVLYMPMEI